MLQNSRLLFLSFILYQLSKLLSEIMNLVTITNASSICKDEYPCYDIYCSFL